MRKTEKPQIFNASFINENAKKLLEKHKVKDAKKGKCNWAGWND